MISMLTWPDLNFPVQFVGENMNLYRQEWEMPRKSFTPEQIIAKLRQSEVLISQEHSVVGGCREDRISEQSYYRWRIGVWV